MIRLIGLGKMGMNLFENMIDHNIDVLAFDVDLSKRDTTHSKKFIVENMDELVSNEAAIYWLMLPQGEVTESAFMFLLDNVAPSSIIIDAGNAHFRDSIRRHHLAEKKHLSFIDIGVSGGQDGARNGACMMIGGDFEAFQTIEKYVSLLCVDKGYLYTGKPGSGHYLKMVHNGIEYGMMQAIAEGFNIIQNNDLYDYDLFNTSVLFNNGSVIRSWLMELLGNALEDGTELKDIAGVVESSGEGKWTLEEALRLGLNTPVIAQSMFVRFASKDQDKFGERVTASLRNQFGGHSITTKESV